MIECDICELRCKIKKNKTGACKKYINVDDKLHERFKDSYLFTFPIAIETQPMLHFYPNHKFLQLSTIGCNFKCKGCISEVLISNLECISKTLTYLSAEEIIQKAKDERCKGISFGINDPIVSFFSFKEIAQKAKENDLLVGFSSNLYFTEKRLKEIAPFIDFVNVGVKGFSDRIYKEICKVPKSSPVFRNIKLLYEHGIHIEVSIPFVKGQKEEVLNTAKFLSRISDEIPLQIMRFIPFGEAEISLEPTIKEAENLVKEAQKYLKYVYLFNSPGSKYLNTNNQEVEIKRDFYGPMGSHIKDFKIKKTPLKTIKGEINKKDYVEEGFFGGYRITRATELIIGMLNALGIYNPLELNEILSKVLKDKHFMIKFHESVDNKNGSTIYSYLNILEELSIISNKKTRGNLIKEYITDKLKTIEEKSKTIKNKKSFYYCMGYPLFALNSKRMECLCAEFIGCINLNEKFNKKGKPGFSVTTEELNTINPDIAFISGFISIPKSDFYDFVNQHNIYALKNTKVYKIPIGWDFSSLNWILGTMYMAVKAYPEIYDFDMEKEKKEFYNVIYNSSFNPKNHSFYNKFIKGEKNEINHDNNFVTLSPVCLK
jgi:pyruvate-formate lyase-activating enzyme